MKIIKVSSCKDCPYKDLNYSFVGDDWILRCGKHKDGLVVSRVKYTKEKLVYKIPDWCNLEELK